MRWTQLQKLADKKRYYIDKLNYAGPSCYELTIRNPDTGTEEIVYVGETQNEAVRLRRYGSSGSHLAKLIDWHLRQGWVIRYRACALPSKAHAIRMQNNLLAKYDYRWNKANNC